MRDLDDRFRALREIRPPDLWPEIERRRPTSARPRVPWRGLLAAALAVAFLGAAVLVAPTFFRGEQRERPATTAGFAVGWTELPLPPESRSGASSVWTGTEVLVWGGCVPQGEDCRPTADGFAFDPSRRTWRALPPAPGEGSHAHPVWTGREALFFVDGDEAIAGLAFDPVAGSWRTIPSAPVRSAATLVWTGTEVVAYGGGLRGEPENVEGAAYDPAADTWRRLPDAPVGLNLASGAWTGREVVVFGSLLSNRNIAETATSVGAAYDPAANRWRELPPSDLSPQATSARWIAGRVVAWDYEVRAQEYDPETNTWTEPVGMPLEFSECYPDSALVGGRLFAFFCGQAALYDPVTGTWEEIRGGPLDEKVEGLDLWRFASLVPAGDVAFLLMEGITFGRRGEPCYGCPGYPLSFWAYRPPGGS